jgi:hypothetical protein
MRVALVLLALAVAASPTYGADPSAKCAAAKRKAAGKKIAGKMTCYGKAKALAGPVDGECLARAEAKFSAAFAKLGAACPGTAMAVEGILDECVGTLLGDVPGDGPCPSRSAKTVGKWAKALLACAARDMLAPGTFGGCDTRVDAKNAAAIARAGDCAAGTTHADLHSACVAPVVDALPATTTTTTTTLPCQFLSGICVGSCGTGESCGLIGFHQCACLAPGACGGTAYPTCGGDCPAGQTCYPYKDPSGLGFCSCGDTDVGCGGLSLPCTGIACPTGFVCDIQVSGCGCTMP